MTMTETLHSPDIAVLPYGAHSPLAYLLNLVSEAEAAIEHAEREAAETAAIQHLSRSYPYSLARAIDVTAWQGYPAVRDSGQVFWEPSAVAWLDGGLWLHHTVSTTEADGASDVLTLMVPCTCGLGYSDIALDSEETLMEILAELRPTRGRSVHHTGLLDCASVSAAPSPFDDLEGKADLEMQARDSIRE